MKAKKQGLKNFTIQVSGLATFDIRARDENDALERFAKRRNKEIFEYMELDFDVVENHG